MKSQQEYIDIIKSHSQTLRNEFGVQTLQLFGSVARNEQTDNSDVDVCVTMVPKLFLIIRLRRYLENILGTPVDVVRKHRYLNPLLLSEIDHDSIYVLR